jgi:hypothetical protein
MRVRPDLPIVHEFLTYPTDWFGHADRVNAFYRPVLENLAGRIYCSRRMQTYFSNHFRPGRSLELLRVSRCPRDYFPRRHETRENRAPLRVICLATFDYLRAAGDVNDILPRLQRIADAGIEVHALRPPGEPPAHPRLNWFDRITPKGGALADFAGDFDACVVLYNLQNPALDRTQFINSMPERFLFALILGIPVVLPADELLSCEEFITEHAIGFAYRSEEELRARLQDGAEMNRLRTNAQHLAAELALEDDLPNLLEFLEQARRHYCGGSKS